MSKESARFTPRYLRARDVAHVLGVGTSTVWRWQRQGILPKGTRLTARCTVWEMGDVEGLISAGRTEQGAANA